MPPGGTVEAMTTERTLRPGSLHLPGSPGLRRLNAAMGAAGLAAFGMLYATQPLLPELGADFGVDPTRASLTISVTTGALALLVIPATAVGIRVGRARTIRIGLLVATALTLLSALAPSYDVLLALRALTGAALAAVVSVAMGHVAAEVHPSGLATAMGLYIAGNSLGGVGGRLVTSAVVDLSSWRWAVAALGVCALLATAVFWRLLPPSVALAEQQPDTDGPTPTRGALARLLVDPSMLAVLVVPFVLMGGFVATYNFLTYRLREAPFDLPSSVLGLVFLAYLAGTVSSAVAGRAADAVGRPRVLLVSILVMAIGIAISLPDWLPTVVAGLVIFTAGFFGAHSTASGWAPVVGRSSPSQASALYVCSYYAGSSVFGALVGLSWRTGGWPATTASVGALVGVGLLAALVVVRRRRHLSGPGRTARARRFSRQGRDAGGRSAPVGWPRTGRCRQR